MPKNSKKSATPADMEKRRKYVENTAAFGLVVLCCGLALPFASSFSMVWMQVGKWAFTAGAAIFLVARLFGTSDPDESLRLRRLRRMESWAGMAFAAASFFWFWNEAHKGPYAGPLAVIRDTIMFALAGALIQIIASWLIVWRQKKEGKNSDTDR